MANQKIRIRLRAYDHELIDYNLKSCSQVQRLKRTVRTKNT